jgi:hypothetical protein
MVTGIAVVSFDSGSIFFAYDMAFWRKDVCKDAPGIGKEEAVVKMGNLTIEAFEGGLIAPADNPGNGFPCATVNGFDDPFLIFLFLAKMPHFIEFYFRNFLRYFRIGHFESGVNDPPIDKRRPGLEQISQHVEGCLAHRIQEDAQSFQGADFLVSSPVSFYEMTVAFFAEVSLLFANKAVFHAVLRSASFTYWHNMPPKVIMKFLGQDTNYA